MASSASGSSTIVLANLASSVAATTASIPGVPTCASQMTTASGPSLSQTPSTNAPTASSVTLAATTITPPTTPPPATSPTTSRPASPSSNTARKPSPWLKKATRLCGGMNPWMLFLTVVAVAIAVFGIMPVLKSLALARWTAIKDYREHCAALEGTARQVIDISCKKALDQPLPPPPIRPRYFEANEVDVGALQPPNSPENPGTDSKREAPGSRFLLGRKSSVVWACLSILVLLVLLYEHKCAKYRRRKRRLPSTDQYGAETQVPLAVPRMDIYSSAVGQSNYDMGLKHRNDSQQRNHTSAENEGAWELAKLSSGFKRDHTAFTATTEPDDVEDDMRPVPGSDSDTSDLDSADYNLKDTEYVWQPWELTKKGQRLRFAAFEGKIRLIQFDGPAGPYVDGNGPVKKATALKALQCMSKNLEAHGGTLSRRRPVIDSDFQPSRNRDDESVDDWLVRKGDGLPKTFMMSRRATAATRTSNDDKVNDILEGQDGRRKTPDKAGDLPYSIHRFLRSDRDHWIPGQLSRGSPKRLATTHATLSQSDKTLSDALGSERAPDHEITIGLSGMGL